MPQAAALGRYMIVFEGDGTHLDKTLQKSEKNAARSAAAINKTIGDGVSAALRAANKEAMSMATKLAEGSRVTAGDLGRLAAATLQVRHARTSDAAAARLLTAAQERLSRVSAEATSRARQQRIELENLRNATREAGFHYNSLSGAVADVARGYGPAGVKAASFVAKLAAGSLILREVINLTKGLVAVGAGEEGIAFWEEQIDRITAAYGRARRSLFDFYVTQGQFTAARMRGDTQGMVDAAKGAATDLLAPLPKTGTGAFPIPRPTSAADKKLAEMVGDRVLALELEEAQLRKNAEAQRRLTLEMIERKRADLEQQKVDPKVIDFLLEREARTAKLRFETEKLEEAEKKRRESQDRADAFKNLVRDKLLGAASKRVGAAALFDQMGMAARERLSAILAAESRYQETRVAMNRAATDVILRDARLEADVRMSMLDRVTFAYAEQATSTQQVMMSALGSVEGFIGDILTPGAIQSFNDLADAGRNAARSIAAEFARLMAQKAILWLLNMFGGSSLPRPNTSALSALIGLSPGVKGAMGGIMPGGFVPLSKFAAGGVVTSPTIGLVGEGRHNEAIVPLPDGRSIPVEMRGGRGGRQVIENHMTVMLAPGFMNGIVNAARRSDGEITMVIAEDILTNGPLRRIIQQVV